MHIIRHIIAIALWLISLSVSMTYVSSSQEHAACHSGIIESRHQLQLTCCRQHNNDAERVTPVTAPSPSLRTSHITPRHTLGMPALCSSRSTSSHYGFTTYLTPTLGVRATDYFLYTLCRLRI